MYLVPSYRSTLAFVLYISHSVLGIGQTEFKEVETRMRLPCA